MLRRLLDTRWPVRVSVYPAEAVAKLALFRIVLDEVRRPFGSYACQDIVTRTPHLVLGCHSQDVGQGRKGLDGQFLDIDSPTQ